MASMKTASGSSGKASFSPTGEARRVRVRRNTAILILLAVTP